MFAVVDSKVLLSIEVQNALVISYYHQGCQGQMLHPHSSLDAVYVILKIICVLNTLLLIEPLGGFQSPLLTSGDACTHAHDI